MAAAVPALAAKDAAADAAREIPDTPAAAVPAWYLLVTPWTYAVLALLAAWRLTTHGGWGTFLAGSGPPDTDALAIQMRMSLGMRRGNDYGRRKPGLLARAVARVKRFGKSLVSLAKGFARWVRGNPIDVVMLLIFLCSWALWLNPALEAVFLVQGFRNPLAFLGSGFACFNIYQLYSDIFYVYILGKAYCVEFSPKELALLYGGGTMCGSLLVALGPGGWMGPTAGTAALLTAFMLRYPGTPMAIPMIPLIFFPFQVRWIGTILALFNFYLFSKGVASGAAFVGGVLFALLLKPRKELQVQDVSIA